MKKVILHLCADIGSDSYPYALDPAYQVILIGERYGVQNVTRTSLLRDYLGKPDLVYQPYEYGSGWTKKTALWGNFRLPEKTHTWETCPKIKGLYIRESRDDKPSLAFQHKNHIRFIKEFKPFASRVLNDADLRSLCSQNFAKAFKAANP